MGKVIPKSCKRNGYKIKYSSLHDCWQVQRMSDKKILEEFAFRDKAIEWAENN